MFAQPAVTVPAWTAVGPVGVNSLQFGLVTGRVSAIALDPSDATGNTAFVGTTGGGLWKSQNAAASTTSSIVFLPLTDAVPALSGATQAGISVGAVTVQPGGTGVVLAGLGDPNDALDSYYGAGLLRSTNGGATWTLITQTMDLEDQLGLQDYSFIGEGFAGFAWSTVNTQLVVAAMSQAYEGTLVNAGLTDASMEGLYWSNDGGATWHLGRITDLNGEDVQGPLDGYSLAPGKTTCTTKLLGASSCVVGVSFMPTASGQQPGTLTVSVSNLGVAPLTVALAGSGQAVGGITASPSQMTFGSVVLRQTSAAQTLTLTNSGLAALAGIRISTTGSFQLTGNLCTATLAAGASCTTGVTMTPKTTGIQTGTLTILTTSAGVVPAVVPLIGNGIPSGALTITPAVVSFGALTVGQTSPPQTVTVTNAGATTLAGLTYHLAGDYSLTQNLCGTQLTSGSMCTFTVTFSPSVPGTRIGSLTMDSSASGFIPVVVGLTGTGLSAAQLAVTPLQLAFGAVAVGSNSASMPLTISNPGTGTLTGLSIATAAPFSAGSGSCGTSLAAGGSCSVPVTFAPQVSGAQSGAVTVATSSLGVASIQIAVSGSGQLPASLSLSSAALTFAGTTVGTTSAGQTVTVSNPGGTGLAGLSLGVTGSAAQDFSIVSSGCGKTLSATGTCAVEISFAPTVAGGRQAFLQATSTTAGVAAASSTLNGTGLTQAALSAAPASVSFPAVLIGQLSATQIVTVKNSGQTGITDLKLAVIGQFALDPTKTTCTAALAAGANCKISVLFEPTSGGAQTGSLTASSLLSGGTAATTALSGTGAFPPGIATSPGALVQFGTTGVGQSAQPVTVTVTNTGTLSVLTGLTLAVDPASTGNGFGLSGSTCGTTLGAGASCTVQVTFKPAFAPQLAEALTGTLTIGSTNGGSASLALAGIAFNLTMNVVGNSSMTVVQGQTAYYTLEVTPQGSSAGAIRFACGTLPANAICLFNPAQLSGLPAGISGNLQLGIAAGASATAFDTRRRWRTAGLLLCGLLGLPLAWSRRSHKRSYARWLLGALLCAWMICGVTSCAGSGGSGGSGGSTHGGGGTPLGSYPVTVTATSDGISKSVSLTFIVN